MIIFLLFVALFLHLHLHPSGIHVSSVNVDHYDTAGGRKVEIVGKLEI